MVSKSVDISQNLSDLQRFSAKLIARAVGIIYTFSRNLVKFRSNSINIGAKNDESHGHLAKFRKIFAIVVLNFCKI